MQMIQRRRDFLASAALAAAAGVLGPRRLLADEGALETTSIRIAYDRSICLAPDQIAEALLRAEGFTDVRYVETTSHDEAMERGEVDLNMLTAAWVVAQVDAGLPITALAGIHPGCYELFAHDPIRTIGDLKGRRVGIPYTGGSGHMLLAIMVAQVGLDPHADIDWVTSPDGNALELFAEGKVDAFLGFPPEPQELRARKIGRVILNMTTDQPWSQYFCCIAFGHRDFVRDNPVATKRALRAILKTADFCAAEPELAAQQLVDAGFTGRYEYALQTLTEVPYDRWREFDSEDSMRFFALRLDEVGMIKSSPNKIIAEGTDWRFLNELKRELKA